MKEYSNKGRMGVCIELKNDNYGSMLQSYATQQILRDYKMDYELIRYKKKYTLWFLMKSLPRALNYVLWHEIKAMMAKKQFLKKHPELSQAVEKRKKAFSEFRKQYFIAPVHDFLGYENLCQGSQQYNSFLSGSDQMWSPVGLPSNFYNLMFVQGDKTKISYASSFGVNKIPWFQISRTKRYLNRIQFVSCRENSGKKIVKELTDRDVPVVVDPTMLYTGEQWIKMLPSRRVCDENYIFSYLLGPDQQTRREVEKLSKATGLKIVSIHQYLDADLNFGDVSVEDAGPSQFVDLIRNAEYVCTDSFHGSVFSVLLHKKFVVFNRYSDTYKASKNTRIESFCEYLGLENRRFSGDIMNDMLKEIDYEKIENRISSLRDRSYSYIEEAFDSI